ncbi:MAG TPA: M4 family metallopeptidase [Pyrinomonadaceae bacterium]|jgi:thermolysin
MRKAQTLLIALIVCGLAPSALPVARAQGQRGQAAPSAATPSSSPEGRLVRNHFEGRGARPEWADRAFRAGKSLVAKRAAGRRDALREDELELVEVAEDDLKQTHVRMVQVSGGVPVYGSQVIAHLDSAALQSAGGRATEGALLGVSGRTFAGARRTGSAPSLTPARAIAIAREALAHSGNFARPPEAQLVILPQSLVTGDAADEGATLTFRVELLVTDGSPATGRHLYFVDARDGSVVWHYDNLQRDGIGFSLYNGVMWIATTDDPSAGDFILRDPYRCSTPGWVYPEFDQCLRTSDMFNTYFTSEPGVVFRDPDNYWGDGTNANRQTAGVDAHIGSALTWDYYLYQHGRRGIDGAGYPLLSRVHYEQPGSIFSFNAFWDGNAVAYGDGDGVRHFAALDVVGHEITHGVTQYSANLVYAREPGALNESFSDVFGTVIEFYGGINPDYLLGEDINAFGQGPVRNMADPPSKGNPDHYDRRSYPGLCTPDFFNDNCGVHDNSGIQNKAFYLLAEGGVHPYSGVYVPGIGRHAAAQIFYRALTTYLFPSANYFNARSATVQAAADIYGAGSAQHSATAATWDAVGVPANPIDETRFFVRQLYSDLLGRGPDSSGYDNWSNFIAGCGLDYQCKIQRHIETARGFMESGEFRQRVGGAFNPASPGPGDTPYNREYVRQCYLAYLRREPDPGGYNAWLNYLANTGDYNGVTHGFIYSTEYRLRFGPA